MIALGLGEYQSSPELRSDAYHKGYIGGQPDLLILNLHKKCNGFALEMKHPGGTGKLKPNQRQSLDNLEKQNWKVMVSGKYDDIVVNVG
jgi:hypothetical protein